MVEQRQSAIQRIQVGLVGLVIVLLFVTLANMVLDRVSKSAQMGGSSGAVTVRGDAKKTPDEPLAELGVTPVAKDGSQVRAANQLQPSEREAAPATRP